LFHYHWGAESYESKLDNFIPHAKAPIQVNSPFEDTHGFFAAMFALIAPERFV
jgi:hypothetical protein